LSFLSSAVLRINERKGDKTMQELRKINFDHLRNELSNNNKELFVASKSDEQYVSDNSFINDLFVDEDNSYARNIARNKAKRLLLLNFNTLFCKDLSVRSNESKRFKSYTSYVDNVLLSTNDFEKAVKRIIKESKRTRQGAFLSRSYVLSHIKYRAKHQKKKQFKELLEKISS
jgi:hypothetical protein